MHVEPIGWSDFANCNICITKKSQAEIVVNTRKCSHYVLPTTFQLLPNFHPSLNKKGNLPAAQCSSSAPFSQSRSPSHRHDNETHLLAEPPQSNFSGGHVCRPGAEVQIKNSNGGGKEEKRVGKMDSGEKMREEGRDGEKRQSQRNSLITWLSCSLNRFHLKMLQ